MANLAADSKINFQRTSPSGPRVFPIANSVQMYVGSLLKLNGGYADKLTNSNVCIGVAVAPGVPGNFPPLDGQSLTTLPIPMIAKGNTAAAAGNLPSVICEQASFTWMQVTLTLANGSLAGTIADVGTKIYAGNTDNIADATNTQPGSDKPLGIISNFYSFTATTATYDIDFYDFNARTRGN